MFGAVKSSTPAPPQPAASPANQTMVFGTSVATAGPTPGSSATARPNQTLAFGSVVPPAGKPASTTLMFGTPAATQGAKSPEARVPGSSAPTQPVPVQAPAVAPPKNQTMVFGKSVAPAAATFGTPAATQGRSVPPAAVAANQTLMFGTAEAPPEPAKNQTMMFGRSPPTTSKPIPKVTAGSAESAGYAANEAPDSTVRVDLESLTGTNDGPVPELPGARHDRTQRFAMGNDAPRPVAKVEPVDERHNRTVLFAMNPQHESTTPEGAPAAAPESAHLGPTPQDDGDSSKPTQMFSPHLEVSDAKSAALALEPSVETPPQASFAVERDGEPLGLASFEAAPGASPGLDLPPEPTYLPPSGDTGSTDPNADEAAFEAMRAASNRRTTIAVVIFLFIALALALALLWYVFGRTLFAKGSAEISEQTQEAVAELRKDDEASRDSAISKLQALATRAPERAEVHGALVMALALSVDDLSAEVGRRRHRVKQLQSRVEGLAASSTSRGPLVDQLTTANEELTAAESQAKGRATQLVAASAALERSAARAGLTPEQTFSVVRARALTAAIHGDASAVSLAEEAHQKSPSPDNWADLVLPEYVINGGSSYDDALKQLEIVEARDTTFLRAYVLAARIHVIQRNLDGAEEQLARVLALHPDHESARSLQAWIASRKKND